MRCQKGQRPRARGGGGAMGTARRGGASCGDVPTGEVALWPLVREVECELMKGMLERSTSCARLPRRVPLRVTVTNRWEQDAHSEPPAPRAGMDLGLEVEMTLEGHPDIAVAA